MSMLRMRAAVTGLLELGKVNEWIVTDKLGTASQPAHELHAKLSTKQSKKNTPKR